MVLLGFCECCALRIVILPKNRLSNEPVFVYFQVITYLNIPYQRKERELPVP